MIDGVHGLSVPVDDVKETERALRRLIDDTRERQKMAVAAEGLVSTCSWKSYGEKVLAAIQTSGVQQ